MESLVTYTEAASVLGTDIRTVSGLVVLLGIEPKPFPHNGNAKGLDKRDIRAIKTAIRAGRKALMVAA